MGHDFNVLYDSGLDLWRGQYTGLYPLPINGLFALLALLPSPVSFILFSIVGLALFVAVLRRRALAWILFQPVLVGLYLGQLDLIWLWLLTRASPVSLALMTLKPTLFPMAIPVLLADRAKWRPFSLACAVLYGPITLIRPSWPLEWMRAISDRGVNWHSSATILGDSSIIGFAVLLICAALIRLDWRSVFWSVNPAIRWYDFTLMAGSSLWLIPVSWVLYGIAWTTGNPSPIAFLGLIDLALRRYDNCRK